MIQNPQDPADGADAASVVTAPVAPLVTTVLEALECRLAAIARKHYEHVGDSHSYRGCGNPGKLLREFFASDTARAEFGAWLDEQIGEDAAVAYTKCAADWKQVSISREDEAQPMFLPASLFAYDNCSTAGPVMLHKSKLMAEHILKDGFVSHSEPLFVLPPDKDCIPAATGILPKFSVTYVKGQSRMVTALAILAVMKRDGMELREAAPLLWKSLQRIQCKSIECSDAQEQLHRFYGFKISSRGSLREAPTAVTWVHALLNLQKTGRYDCQNVLTAWNSRSVKADQVTGGKYMSVKNLLDLPDKARGVVMDTASRLGFKSCPFSDDNLSSKKLVPGFLFRCPPKLKNSKWPKMSTVTAESTALCLESAVSSFEASPLRKRLSKSDLEERLEMCTLAVGLRDDLVQSVAGIEGLLAEKWMSRVRKGDGVIEMELCTALRNKTETFGPRDIPSLSKLIDQCSNKSAGLAADSTATAESLDLAARDLAKKQFECLLSETKHDQQVFEIYLQNRANHTVNVQGIAVQYQKKLSDEARAAVEKWWDKHVTTYIWAEDEAAAGMQLLWQYKQSKQDLLKVTVSVQNLISPCLVSAAHLSAQMQVVQHVLAEDARNLGLVLLPVFSHKKNGRYAEEELIMKELGKIGCNLDHSFSVIFADRTDARDERPLNLAGRFLCPTDDKGHIAKFWAKSALLVKGRTTEAAQIKATDMMKILDPSAVPTTNADEPLRGALKYAQIGRQAASRVLDGPTVPSSHLLEIVDMVPLVGNFLEAFVDKTQQCNLAMHYTAVFPNDADQEWFIMTHQDLLIQQYRNSELKVSPEELPREQVLAPPELPSLKQLVYGKDTEGNAQMVHLPEALIQKWFHDPIHGSEFRGLVDELAKRYGTLEDLKTANQAQASSTPSAGSKRLGVGPAPAAKRLKFTVSPEQCIAQDKMIGIQVAQVPLLNIRVPKDVEPLSMSIRDNGSIYLVNPSTDDVSVPFGTVLSGFGKGKFSQLAADATLDDRNLLLFHMKGPSDLVVFDGKLMEVQAVLAQRLAAGSADVKLAYHKTEQVGGQTWNFTKEHNISFKPEDLNVPDKNKIPQNSGSLGSADFSKWNSDLTQVLWTVSWTVTGLSPVRPVVATIKDVTLPKTACVLLPAAS
ncbi:unnamed protein product [Symbiodinium sp. CCMP2592]|nr:unnamed protein product [Symbiodinium sp. CCMP2592]